MAWEIDSFRRSPLSPIVMGGIYAIVWFYLQLLVQFFIFSGESSARQDFGAATFLPAWLISLTWGWIVTGLLSKRLMGRNSPHAYILGAVIAVPFAAVFSLTFGSLLSGSNQNWLGDFFDGIFYFLTLYGELPEGRAGWGVVQAAMFFWVLMFGMLGFHLTRRDTGVLSKGSVLLLLLLPCLCAPKLARAWSDDPTHKDLLTEKAIVLLDTVSDNPYYQLQVLGGNIAQGAQHEDQDGIAIYRTHFYNPTDQSGLALFTAKNAMDRLNSGGPNGQPFFASAVSQFRAGNKVTAYELLGHALHLATQDMFSPGHVHIDVHIGTTDGEMEVWEKNNHSWILNDERANAESISPTSGNPANTLHLNADYTYRAVRIRGQLNVDFDNPTSQDLSIIFPTGAPTGISLRRECVGGYDMWAECVGYYEHVWQIANVGDCRERSGRIGIPGANDHWWKAKEYGGGEADEFFYFERPAFAYPTQYKGVQGAGKTLAEMWALDVDRLLAKSQASSAGLIKQFAATVDLIPPKIEILDAEGNATAEDGLTSATAIKIRATDPTNPTQPAPSGIYRIWLTQTSGGTFTDEIDGNGANEAHVGPHYITTDPYPNLTEGTFEVKACDGLANCTQKTLRVDKSGPEIIIIPPNAGFTNRARPEIQVTLSDLAGVDATSVKLFVDGAEVTPTITGQNPVVAKYTPIADLNEGQHQLRVEAKDTLSNSSTLTSAFAVDLTFPTMEFLDPGAVALSYGWATESPSADVRVMDAGSGVASFDVYLGDPDKEGTSIYRATDVTGPDVLISASANQDLLMFMAALPEGEFYLVASDQAGNKTKKRLAVDRHPALVTLMEGELGASGFEGLPVGLDHMGDNISAVASWVHKPAQGFRMQDVGGVIALKIYNEVGLVTEAYSQPVSTITDSFVGMVGMMPDHADYVAVFWDVLGHVTKFKFSQDKTWPQVNLTRVKIAEQAGAYYYAIEGTASDGLSGVVSVSLPARDNVSPVALPGTPSAPFALPSVVVTQGMQDVALYDVAGNLGRGAVVSGGAMAFTSDLSMLLDDPNTSASRDVVFAGGSKLANVSASIENYDILPPSPVRCETSPVDVGKVQVYAKSDYNDWPEGTAPQATIEPIVPQTPDNLVLDYAGMGSQTASLNAYVGQKLTLRAVRSPGASGCQATDGSTIEAGRIYPVATIHAGGEGLVMTAVDEVIAQHVDPYSNVFMSFPKEGITLSLAYVTRPGDMSVIVIPGDYAPPEYTTVAPGSAWDITTTAEYTGPVTITAKYDPGPLGLSEYEQGQIKMVHHGEGGSYEFVNATVNTQDHTVTGSVSHFSLFSLVIPNGFVHRPDKTPPTTTLSFVGPAVGDSTGNVVISQYRTSLRLTAVDPIVAMEQTSGEATTYYLIDWTPEQCGHAWGRDPVEGHGEARGVCDNTVYGGEFMLEEGTHTIYYGSRDVAGNLEPMASAYITVDGTPPDTQLVYSGPVAPSSGGGYVLGPQSTLRLVATDPSSRGVSVGVATTYYLVDVTPQEDCGWTGEEPVGDPEGPPGSCSNPVYHDQEITLPEGTHLLTYFAVDWLGNLAWYVSTSVAVDATPPDTAFIPQGPNDIDEQGRMVISSNTPISLIASDPVSNGVSAGVGKPWFLIDVQPSTCAPNGVMPPYVSTAPLGSCQNYIFFPTTVLTLPEGTHRVRYYSRDRVGNTKDWKGQPVDSDATPPITTLSVQGSSASLGGAMVVSSQTYMVFSATDPVSGGVNAGVMATLFVLNTPMESCHWGNELPQVSTAPAGSCDNPFYSSSFSFTMEGTNTLGYLSLDKVANIEELHSSTVILDSSPPSVAIASPGEGETFVAGQDAITVSFAVLDNRDVAPVFSAALVHTSGSSVTVSSGQTIDPASLLDGYWELRVSAVDFVQNSTVVASGRFTIIRDILPPRTSLVLGQPSVPGDPAWVKSTTLLTLEAVDDAVTVGDAHGMGVARTSYSLDAGAFLEYSSAGFHLSGESTHDVAYRSVDVLGHAEVVKVSSVAVDETPPSIAFTQPAANAVLNTATPIIQVSYSDAGSGIDKDTFTIVVDGGADQGGQASRDTAMASITLAPVGQGPHTVTASIADRLGNRRSVSLSFSVDSIPPQVTMTQPPDGSYVNLKRPVMQGVATDLGSGLNTNSISMRLDESVVGAQVSAPVGGGTPGAWESVGTLPEKLLGMGIAVWNGILYVSGGSDNASPYKTAVRYAPIQADGRLGQWHEDTSHPLPIGMLGHRMVAVDNMLFVLGGYNSTMNETYKEVYMSRINPDGSLGPWTQSDALPYPFGAQSFAAVAFKGYLYAMGGENNPYGQLTSQVYYAQICPQEATGLCSPWQTTTSFPGPLAQVVAVTVGDSLYIYVPGGAPSGGGSTSQVLYTSPKADGSLNEWRYTQSLPRFVANHAAVGAEGHIYVMGGTPSVEPVKTVDFAAVNADGTVENWTEDPQYYLPTPLLSAAAVSWDGRVYLVGGRGGQTEQWKVSDVVYASLVRSEASVASATATYTPGSDLAEGPHTLSLSAMDKAGNQGSASRLFVVDTLPPTLSATVAGQAAGGDDPWVNTARPTLGLAYSDASSGVDATSLVLRLDGSVLTVQAGLGSASFTPGSDLTQGPHELIASIDDLAGNHASITVRFRIDSVQPQVAIATPASGVYFTTSSVPMAAYYADGESGLSTATIQLKLDDSLLPALVAFAGVSTLSAGIPDQWIEAGLMPGPLLGMAAVAHNGMLYISGGSDNAHPYTNQVYYAPIRADGSIGDWQTGPILPRGLLGHRMVAVDGRMFVLGGYNSTENQTYNQVYSSRILSDGTLEGWTSSVDLPYPFGAQSFAAAALNGYLYAMGGENNPYGQLTSQVYYAQICPQEATGLCSPWQTTTSFPGPLAQVVAVTVGDSLYIYVPGGAPSGGGSTSQVLYTSPKADGSLNEWLYTQSLPRSVANHAAVGAEGHIYVMGGTPSVEPVKTVDFAAVNADGTVGNWTEDPQYYLPTPLLSAAAVSWDGRVYLVGGRGGQTEGWQVSNRVYSSVVRHDTAVVAATATYIATISQGQHMLRAETQDLAANVGYQEVAFGVDWTPPVSSLTVEGVSRSFGGKLYVQGQSSLRISTADAVSGVAETWLRVDGGGFAANADPIILAQGNHELEFYSVDNAGNVESTKTASVKMDAVAPAVAADLVAVIPSTTGMTLAWTSPGDDGADGTILSGEFRVQYASLPTTFDPSQAQIVENVIDQASGTAKSLRIDGLSPGTDYTFALWTKDTAGNYSAAATASAQTLSLAASADQVASIISPEPLLTVSTVTQATAAGPLSVSTTQGLGALTATFYELNTGSTETVHFSTPAVLSFVFNGTGVELSQVAIFKYLDVGGVMVWSSAPIVNQTLTLVDGGPYWQITGQIYSASLYSVFEKRDILPPRTTLALGEPKYVAGETYLTAVTNLSLSAADDRSVVGDGDGAGVSGTQYALDGGAAALYTGPVRLSGEGPHDFAFFSVDLKNNLEARQSRRLVVDGTPPATTVSLSTPSFEAFVSPLTTLKLSAQDPPAGTVPGSGLNKIIYAVGAGQLGQGPLELGLQGPDGKYELSYQAQDNLGNQETLQKKTYSLDSTPAVSVADIGAHSYSAPDGKKYVSPLTPITLSAEDQIVNEVASGVQLIAVDLGQGYAPYAAPLTFAAGHRQIQYRATDNVGNIEQGKTLELYVDGTAPATLLSYDGYHLPRAETTLPPAEAEMFIMPQTKLILTAEDSGEIASGVVSTEYRLDEGAWTTYSEPFLITLDGLHTLAWRSKDRVDNEETNHSLKIDVIGDILPPRTAMLVGEPKYAGSLYYVASRTELFLSAIDDRLTVGDGLGVGVDRTEYSVDAGASARYSAPVKLSGEGPHAVAFFSADLLGHVEAAQSQALVVDDAPPATLVSLSTPSFGAYVSPLTTVKLSAQDPAAGSVPGSGLAKLLYAVGSGPLAEGVLEFGLKGADGKYELNYQAQDNLSNLETSQKIEYSLDGTPPLSASAIGSPSYTAPDGKKYVSPLTPITLSSQDPAINEVASGLKLIEVDLGQGFAAYQDPINLTAGRRELRFRASDNVGNIEQIKSLDLFVDGIAPVTSVAYDGFHLTRAENPTLPPPEAEEFISPQTKVILTTQDPGTDAVSGVKLTEYHLDDGAWVAYSAPFSITAEGLHTLAWRSKDQVDNEETVHSVKIAVMGDIQPPRTVMSIGTPKYVAADTYLTSATELTLTAVDDRLTVGDGLGLGVEKTEYSLDAGVLARYAAPIKLSGNGPHDVAFFSTDVLGHAEASQSRHLLVDDAPPITELVLSGLRFTAQSGDPYAVGGPLFIASTTLTALQAQDPLVNGSASGLASLSYGLDTTALGPYSAAFTVTPQGAHALKYLAVDNLGNTESLKNLSFSVDAAPPVTQISFTGPYFMQSVNSGAVPPEAEVFIARETRIVLTAHDPVVAETASGVGEIRYRLDGGAWLAYSQSLAILSGGLHTLEWYAKDRLGLEEAVHSLRIAVDVAAPISSLSIGEPKSLALGLDFVTPQTPIALSAIDLPNSGIAVGVQGISYRIDAGAELLCTASFTLAQGTHTIEFWAYDRAGNVEYRQSRLLTSTLLQTAALTGVDGITGSGTAQVTGKVLSNGRVALSGSVRVLGDAAGSPVALTGNASVSGIVSQNGAGTMPEPIDLALAEQLASAASSNALIPASFMKDGALVVTGNKTLLLATGTYVLKGLTLSGGASLDVAGPVRLFLDGPLQVSGGAKLNAGGTASNLVLLAKSGSIALSGGAQAVGLFYAPRSSLGISGNARIGGALFAKSVAITGDSNVIAAGEVLPPELIASGGTPGKGGKTADFSAGGLMVAQGAADPSFQLRDLYAFPNPAVGGAKPVIHAAVGVADRVVVKIFDVSGRQTKEATLDGSPQVLDDGSGPKYAYEYTWDGHIPSGVYFYTIEAEKSGQKIRKAGRLAVVR